MKIIIAAIVGMAVGILYQQSIDSRIITELGDCADFNAAYFDSGIREYQDSAMIHRAQAYELGYRGWY
jgi:hypothetical protein